METKKNGLQRAVLYARVSTEEQAAKDLSIPAQLTELRRFALAQGFQVVEEFVDEGFSAYVEATKRPSFQEMMRFCLKRKADAVLVWKFDRFSRLTDDARLYKGMLASSRVRVISISEPIDDSPAGFLLERMLEVFAEFYPRMLATDVKRGLKARVERGLRPGGSVAYGYRIERRMVEGRIESHLALGPDFEVATVKQIFEWSVNEKLGGRRIADRLNAANIKGPVDAWRNDTVSCLIRNPIYMGMVAYVKRTKEGKRKLRNPSPTLHPGIHPAIVDRALWHSAQIAMDGRRRKNGINSGHSNILLSGLLWCWCGRRCWHSFTKVGDTRTYEVYQCSARRQGKQCTSPRIPRQLLESTVLIEVQSFLSKEMIDDMEAELQTLYNERLKQYSTPEDVNRKRSLLRSKIDRLYETIENGGDIKECLQRINQYNLEVAGLEDKKPDQMLERLTQARNRIQAQLNRLKAKSITLHELPLAVQRDLLMTLVDRIDLTPEGIGVSISLRGAVIEDYGASRSRPG